MPTWSHDYFVWNNIGIFTFKIFNYIRAETQNLHLLLKLNNYNLNKVVFFLYIQANVSFLHNGPVGGFSPVWAIISI